MGLLSKVIKIYDRIIDVTVIVAGVFLIFLMLSVGWEVTLRYFLGRPTSWVVEFAGYILLYIPFLVAAWVLRREGHVRMDLLLVRLSPKAQALINAITSFLSAIICLILTWSGVKITLYLYKTGYKTPTILMLPKWIISVIIFVGSFLLFIQFLRRAYGNLKIWRTS